VPLYKKGVKTECGNYTDIFLLPITLKILPFILLSMLTPYAEKIVGNFYVWISTPQFNY